MEYIIAFGIVLPAVILIGAGIFLAFWLKKKEIRQASEKKADIEKKRKISLKSGEYYDNVAAGMENPTPVDKPLPKRPPKLQDVLHDSDDGIDLTKLMHSVPKTDEAKPENKKGTKKK